MVAPTPVLCGANFRPCTDESAHQNRHIFARRMSRLALAVDPLIEAQRVQRCTSDSVPWGSAPLCTSSISHAPPAGGGRRLLHREHRLKICLADPYLRFELTPVKRSQRSRG